MTHFMSAPSLVTLVGHRHHLEPLQWWQVSQTQLHSYHLLNTVSCMLTRNALGYSFS